MGARADLMDSLKKKIKQGHQNVGKRGLGKKTILDLSLAGDKVISWYTPKVGNSKADENKIDLLPFEVTEPWYKDLRQVSGEPNTNIGADYKLEIAVHGKIGPDEATVICLRESFGKKCPICEERFEEMHKDKPDEKKVAALKHKWICFYNVYDYDDDGKYIQLWQMSYYNFEKALQEASGTDDEGVICFAHLTEGSSIVFKAKEESFAGVKYPKVTDIKEFVDRDPYSEDVFDDVFPLDKMVAGAILSYEQIARIFLGLEEDDDLPPGDREETAPVNRRSRAGRQEEPPAETNNRRRGRTVDSREDIPDKFKCPGGGTFGEDCNNLPECDNCQEPTFIACSEEQDRLTNAKEKEEPAPEPGYDPSTRRSRRRSSGAEEEQPSRASRGASATASAAPTTSRRRSR